MDRNFSEEAVILKTYRVNEFHKGLVLFGKTRGVISAILYGGYRGKSRYAGATESLSHCKLRMYHNPVKNSYKVEEADIISFFDGIMQEWDRTSVAAMACELIIKTSGAGGEPLGHEALFELLAQSLVCLDSASPELSEYIRVQFCWRFLELSGYAPDPGMCGSCGAHADEDLFYFNRKACEFFCKTCMTPGDIMLPASARRYWDHTRILDLDSAIKVRLSEPGFRVFSRIPQLIFHQALHLSLKTINKELK